MCNRLEEFISVAKEDDVKECFHIFSAEQAPSNRSWENPILTYSNEELCRWLLVLLEIAESRKIYADQREEEVKLSDGSIEKLESTLSMYLKTSGEAESQRLQTEELEMELHTIRQ
ncbi:unnamed protein product [Arabis nemorensis]|uniref:Uncharacterized protein n=1 Tax=Arabis nemorensis TaxID=586526 RepID=A0A565AX02_9BRAS|nr:unnamed protein product [Arabis nemorensis]